MTLVKLGEGLSGKLAEQWATAIVTPAFVFWLGGLVVWLSARGFGDGWLLVEAWVRALPGSMQIALAVAALLLFAASGMLAQRLTLPILRILEGYWPAPAVSLKRWLVDRVGGRIQERQVRWNELAARIDNGNATPEERDEARRIDLLLRMYPTRPEDYMPTRLGNILRAAEGWPTDKYGLDAVKCWPGLWLVLPEATRKEIADARARLDSAATIWLWGVLFAVWTFWAWWALPVHCVLRSHAVARIYVWQADRSRFRCASCRTLQRVTVALASVALEGARQRRGDYALPVARLGRADTRLRQTSNLIVTPDVLAPQKGTAADADGITRRVRQRAFARGSEERSRTLSAAAHRSGRKHSRR
jgi:hypothetical protein